METLGYIKLTQFNLKELSLNQKRIQVCAFDPGGANVLAPLIKNLNIEAQFSVKGQAADIFRAYFGNIEDKNHSNLLTDTEVLITSTGWQSAHEFEMMKEALNLGIEVIAVLDHWVNYLDRFTRHGEIVLPTYFLAFDDLAESIIRENFDSPRVLRSENYYLASSVKKINEIRHSSVHRSIKDFLFIGEPISRSVSNSTWDEFKALNLFFSTLRSVGLNRSEIVIKPHPTEDSSKYANVVPKDFPNVAISSESNLEELLSNARFIVGCHSMALYLAEMAGKKVLSCLPIGEKPHLPLLNVEPIETFLNQGSIHQL